jgi:GNAT superfamily N-acetyltransferase
VTIEDLDPSQTHDLRRLVLRGGNPAADVDFATDHTVGAFHLGWRDEGGDLVAVASFSPQPCPLRPGRRAVQLRGMAVRDDWQGRGVGRKVFDEGVARARQQGFEVVWANARDTALDFYRKAGMSIEGEGFVVAPGLPHHHAVMEL